VAPAIVGMAINPLPEDTTRPTLGVVEEGLMSSSDED
jgi:hypothetical protein